MWYVVHTLSRAEAIAEHHLRQAGYGVLYLHYAATIRHARRSFNVLRPYFPRYVFFEANGQGLYGAANAVGVLEIVGCAGEPLEVPERVMDELRRRGDAKGLVDAQVVENGRRRFSIGSRVRVAGGPLEGFFAEVALDDGEHVRVWLQMFGGRIEAIFDPAGLEASASADAR